MSINLDIAGFYYSRKDIVTGANPTVRDVMTAASEADIDARLKGGNDPLMQFMVDPRYPKFLSTISVHHLTRAESRQVPKDPTEKKRSYDPGEYVFSDEPVAQFTNAAGDVYFIATDLKGNPTGASSVQTWQYYVYDADGVERSRRPEGTPRVVVPFSDQPVSDGSTIVWRIVTIFLGPNWQGGTKSATPYTA